MQAARRAVQFRDILLPRREPIRNGCNADQRHGDIGNGGKEDGDHDGAPGTAHGEVEMRGIKGCHFKTHKRPGSKDHQAENRISPVESQRSEREERPAVVHTRKTESRSHDNACQKDHGKRSVQTLKKWLCSDEKKTDPCQCQYGNHRLTKVDGISRDRIGKTRMCRIAEQDAHDKEEGGTIQKYNGQIGKAQKPAAEKGMIPPEGFLGIGVDTARHGGTIHQKREIVGDDQHDEHSDQHGKHGSCRPGYREKSGSRHGKHTPAHHAAEGHCPHVQRGQIPIQGPGLLHRRFFHIGHSFIPP